MCLQPLQSFLAAMQDEDEDNESPGPPADHCSRTRGWFAGGEEGRGGEGQCGGLPGRRIEWNLQFSYSLLFEIIVKSLLYWIDFSVLSCCVVLQCILYVHSNTCAQLEKKGFL